jgi:hypothetical protein
MAEGNIGRRYACNEPYDLIEMKRGRAVRGHF